MAKFSAHTSSLIATAIIVQIRNKSAKPKENLPSSQKSILAANTAINIMLINLKDENRKRSDVMMSKKEKTFICLSGIFLK
jgi:DNA-binding transcriptional regulator YhcF (GntR family)